MCNLDEIVDISKVCRSCLRNTGDMKSLYDKYSTEMCFGEVLMSITTLSSMEFYEENDLPRQICNDCFSELNQSYKFVSKCREAEEALRNYFEKVAKVNTSTFSDQANVVKMNAAQSDANISFHNVFLKSVTENKCVSEIKFRSSNKQTVNNELNSEQSDFKSKSSELQQNNTKDDLMNKRYLCSFCGSSFRSNSYLTCHMRIHTGEAPFVCPHCNNAFKTSSYLIRHIRTHTGEKSHLCQMCEKAFIDKQTLRIHMRIHTGEKPFSCNICHKSFNRNSHLIRHMPVHTGEKPFGCTVCQCSFVEKSSLKIHMRVHDGVKPYVCSVCDRSFGRKSNLTIHMRKHNGEKPFLCTLCGSSFRQKSSLNSHMQKHTNI